MINALKGGVAAGARPGLYDWASLDNFLRASNRQQIAHLGVKLRVLGWEIDNTLEPASWEGNLEITPEQLEQLAEMEHRRWVAFYLVHGWTQAGVRSDEAREHDGLVPYCQLSDEIKGQDRNTVRSMGALCRTAGLFLTSMSMRGH